MNVFELFAKIGLDTKDYDKSLDDSEKKTSSFASKIGGGIKTACEVGAKAITAISTATTAVSAVMIKGANDTASYGDNIDKMSQKMGLSAEAYQEWDFVMQHAGTSIESLKTSMKTLASAAETNSKAFQELGISEQEIANLSQEELFSRTIEELQNVEDVTQRTYLAGQLLGKGATELGPLLNMSAEETANMKQEVHDLGGVMSDEAVKASAQYADSMQNLKTAFSGLSRGALSEFLPAITQVMDGLTDLLKGKESGIETISKGFNAFADNLTKLIPKITQTGTKIATAFIKAIGKIAPEFAKIIPELLETIVNVLPDIGKMGGRIVETLIDAIIDSAPTLIDEASTLLGDFASSLGDHLSELIPKATEMVITIVKALTNPANLDKIARGATTLMSGIVDGISEAIPKIVEALPNVIHSIVSFITDTDTVKQIIDSGIKLLSSLVDGASDIIMAIVNALPQIIDGIVGRNGILSAENIGKVIDAGVDLLIKLISDAPSIIEGIIKGIPALITGFLDPQTGLLSAKNIGKMADAGVELFSALVDNTDDIAEALIRAIPAILGAFLTAVAKIMDDFARNIAKFIGGQEAVDQWIIDEMAPLVNEGGHAATREFWEDLGMEEDFDKYFGYLNTPETNINYKSPYERNSELLNPLQPVVLELDGTKVGEGLIDYSGEANKRSGK